jgi:hypothetical protein
MMQCGMIEITQVASKPDERGIPSQHRRHPEKTSDEPE